MTITLTCPNGHKLNCPDQQAGKPGKCPKCGTVVRIPELPSGPGAPDVPSQPVNDDSENPFAFLEGRTDDEQPTASILPGGPRPAAGADAPRPMGGDSETAQIDGQTAGVDEVIFLCPNGHRLHGPSTLVGRPGQCPHCGMRFIIPSPEDVPEDEEEDASEQILIQIDTTSKTPLSGASSSKWKTKPTAPPPTAENHPLANLLLQLWEQKTLGAMIELHLGDGKILVPDDYSRSSMQQKYGVFAVKEANGTSTLTAVAWDAITRIAVRGLGKLPPQLFDKP